MLYWGVFGAHRNNVQEEVSADGSSNCVKLVLLAKQRSMWVKSIRGEDVEQRG